MYSFEKLIVWQKSMDFCELIYKETRKFPKEELFGITSQLRRATTSIPLNISEGCACNSKRDFLRYLNIALCSQYEVATIIKLCKRLNYIPSESYKNINDVINEIGKLLHGLIKSLKNQKLTTENRQLTANSRQLN